MQVVWSAGIRFFPTHAVSRGKSHADEAAPGKVSRGKGGRGGKYGRNHRLTSPNLKNLKYPNTLPETTPAILLAGDALVVV